MLPGENALLTLTARGDEEAFRELFGYYYPKVLTLLGTFISNEEDVKDLAQSIFMKIWQIRLSLSDVRNFGAFLYRMCRNAATDYCRTKKVHISMSDYYEEPATVALDELFFAKEAEIQMDNRLRKMPDKRRTVYTLSRKLGFSNDDIADKMNISKKTVENHLNAALKELRKHSS